MDRGEYASKHDAIDSIDSYNLTATDAPQSFPLMASRLQPLLRVAAITQLGNRHKLIKARIQNYNSIADSGWVDIDQITCLVGKNESGKTAFLQALE